MVEGPTEFTSNTEPSSNATSGNELTEFKELMLAVSADHSASGSSTDSTDNWIPVAAKQSFPVCQNMDDYPSWHPVQNKMNLEFYNSLQNSSLQKYKNKDFV